MHAHSNLNHGQNDSMVSYRHSKELHFKCGGPAAIVISKEMDHNKIDYLKDLVKPMVSFMKQGQITVEFRDEEEEMFLSRVFFEKLPQLKLTTVSA